MKYFKLFLVGIVVLSVSCKQKEAEANDQVIDSLTVSNNKIISSIGETLLPDAKKALAEWEEYQNVDAIMLKYYSISVQEALTNARELAELVTIMKDSIRVPELDAKNVLARIHVLENQTLRLADMSNIPAISDEEVKEEIQKILEVYDAFNSKINTIYSTSALQEALEIDTETPIKIEVEEDKPKTILPKSTSSKSNKQ